MSGGNRVVRAGFSLAIVCLLALHGTAGANENWAKFEGSAKTPTVWVDLASVRPFTKPWSAYGLDNQPLSGPFYRATVRTYRIESNYPAGSVETEQLCFHCDGKQPIASSVCGSAELRGKNGEILDSAKEEAEGVLIFLDHEKYGNTGIVSAAQAVCKQVRSSGGLPSGGKGSSK
ncbi:hypothetical protein [Pseudoxanthomonas sp. CF125]|uniref:hypothetical protein n=1 Tax=Pseudoxanthomonas sp. CF125 TaxID=1855303 RepID=UPI0008818DB3|nr:hypothetical protein [Pseudoxanthomonas sp. CF125]SDQ38821.1 hypothetical protein SAMN05216569_0928 [Pseudoxanthomonas sp. CF125]